MSDRTMTREESARWLAESGLGFHDEARFEKAVACFLALTTAPVLPRCVVAGCTDDAGTLNVCTNHANRINAPDPLSYVSGGTFCYQRGNPPTCAVCGGTGELAYPDGDTDPCFVERCPSCTNDEESEHREFEAAMRDDGHVFFDRDQFGHYKNRFIFSAYRGWQAARRRKP